MCSRAGCHPHAEDSTRKEMIVKADRERINATQNLLTQSSLSWEQPLQPPQCSPCVPHSYVFCSVQGESLI